MQLTHDRHLAYCTNIHRGETWEETFEALRNKTLAVRERVGQRGPFAIGLRLSNQASLELVQPAAVHAFREWLDRHDCYVFTINGFPYGHFHGSRVKEAVYKPDWTQPERLTYTNRLFDILAAILPEGMAGSVSTVPCSFKPFIQTDEQVARIRSNLWQCVEHAALLSERNGKPLRLGLEPEPLCYLETSAETVLFFEQMRGDRPYDPRLSEHLGVTYDACHLAVEFEHARQSIHQFQQNNIHVCKIHISTAVKMHPTPDALELLKEFSDGIYLHQVVARLSDGSLRRYADVSDALRAAVEPATPAAEEWRIHFHVPLHTPPNPLFETTADHVRELLDVLKVYPDLCPHLEMETYTWEVLPPAMKTTVVDQLAAEYKWSLRELAERDILPVP